MKRKHKTPRVSEMRWGARAFQMSPPGMLSFALIVFTLLIGLGIYDRAEQRVRIIRLSNELLSAWKKGDLSKVQKLVAVKAQTPSSTRYRSFTPIDYPEKYIVPVKTKHRPDTRMSPVVFCPEDWKNHQTPWTLNLTQIKDYKIQQVRLWRRIPLGAASAEVTFASNQGLLKRRFVIVCSLKDSRCSILYTQIVPPMKKCMLGF